LQTLRKENNDYPFNRTPAETKTIFFRYFFLRLLLLSFSPLNFLYPCLLPSYTFQIFCVLHRQLANRKLRAYESQLFVYFDILSNILCVFLHRPQVQRSITWGDLNEVCSIRYGGPVVIATATNNSQKLRHRVTTSLTSHYPFPFSSQTDIRPMPQLPAITAARLRSPSHILGDTAMVWLSARNYSPYHRYELRASSVTNVENLMWLLYQTRHGVP
jgi:hypothetical protein